jgi:hypothetical protein
MQVALKEGVVKAPGAALAELADMPTPATADPPAKSVAGPYAVRLLTEQLPTQKVSLGS